MGAGAPPSAPCQQGLCPEPQFRPPGALTPMPAVRVFALTSGVAVMLDFMLQMSAFVALVSLDSRRQEVGGRPSPTLARWGSFLLQRRLRVGSQWELCAGMVESQCPTEK